MPTEFWGYSADKNVKKKRDHHCHQKYFSVVVEIFQTDLSALMFRSIIHVLLRKIHFEL